MQTQEKSYAHIDWPFEHSLAVAEAIREAMETSAPVAVPLPTSHALPQPHLPLRKASAHKLQLQAKRSTPTPLWASTQHQVRGFNPSPVQPLPHIDNITASSEHAFAGRNEGPKRVFRPPLGVQNMVNGNGEQQHNGHPSPREEGGSESRPPSSPLLSQPATPRTQQKNLRTSKSTGDGLRGWRDRFSVPSKRASPAERDTMYSAPAPAMRPSMTPSEEVRSSFRSALTSNSSYLNTSSIHTEHSSMTADSSHSDYVKGYPNWPEADECSERGDRFGEDAEDPMSVEDAIGMYADGFSSAKPSMDTTVGKRSLQTSRPNSQPSGAPSPERKKRPDHRRSQSAGLLTRVQQYHQNENLTVPRPETSHHNRTFTRILNTPATVDNAMAPATTSPYRDRYGFKKATLYTSDEQYDTWNVGYSKYVERRTRKWHAMMKGYGLTTENPYRFPPKSDKVKRYVRKGVPPEFRGAAWFWYAGGPSKLASEPGLYYEMLKLVENGHLSENDREHIERDLNRTYPDNIRFKPDPTTPVHAGGGWTTEEMMRRLDPEPETKIVKSLRRVLQAFAVHKPLIGYCQSLNFIAGLLLLFLDEDEEKTFILLTIVTTTHLPGTHGVALEGANIDIAVLMSCIKDCLPGIYAKLNDKSTNMGLATEALRLPTISLATTAWFMSLFVGTLPIESVLRVWDCLFFEGSKTVFRIALAIFKRTEFLIMDLADPMEIFQTVQTYPRGMLDVNGLVEVCFKRRGGFGHVSQELIERRREERRQEVRNGVAELNEGKRSWRRWRAKKE